MENRCQSCAHTISVEEAVGPQGRADEAQEGPGQGEEANVAAGLPARGHCARSRHQERRHRLRLLAQDVEDLQGSGKHTCSARNATYEISD